MQYAGQTCRGMAYLEQHNYAHRDLACRNILLTNNNVKIADFGLSLLVTNNENNDIRRIIQQQKLPFRWTAPEIFIDTSKYSLKSDIWAYGIVLIEMWTKGDDPYPGKHPEWIRSAVQDGIIHERPDTCPKNIYDQVIKRCFARDPNERPAFAHLSQILNKIAI
ncbi:unnamed protein product [Didymodactylos carnosus]|nr:unnamed protein product [Didymodactylos carnosus]CAF4508920.1 unnamed protein product [Didymodactylos carnosus]